MAVTLVRLAYASHPSAELISEYNRLVDTFNAAQPAVLTPQPVPTPAPAPQPAPVAEQPAPSPKGRGGKAKETTATTETQPPVEPVNEEPPAQAFPPEGWLLHPTAPGFFYKDQDVKSEADLRALVTSA